MGGQEQAGVVIDHVQDLDMNAIGELPVRDVGLPHLVRQLRAEADQAAAGLLLWLGDDQALSP
jgi:hypothetical protein